MAGKFELYKDASEHYRFRLKAGNGQVVATGQAYKSKEACLKGIQSIKNNAPEAVVIELDDDKE